MRAPLPSSGDAAPGAPLSGGGRGGAGIRGCADRSRRAGQSHFTAWVGAKSITSAFWPGTRSVGSTPACLSQAARSGERHGVTHTGTTPLCIFTTHVAWQQQALATLLWCPSLVLLTSGGGKQQFHTCRGMLQLKRWGCSSRARGSRLALKLFCTGNRQVCEDRMRVRINRAARARACRCISSPFKAGQRKRKDELSQNATVGPLRPRSPKRGPHPLQRCG